MESYQFPHTCAVIFGILDNVNDSKKYIFLSFVTVAAYKRYLCSWLQIQKVMSCVVNFMGIIQHSSNIRILVSIFTSFFRAGNGYQWVQSEQRYDAHTATERGSAERGWLAWTEAIQTWKIYREGQTFETCTIHSFPNR